MNMRMHTNPALLNSNFKLIEGDDKTRTKKCKQAVDQTLANFKCTMIPEFTFFKGGIQQGIKTIGKLRQDCNQALLVVLNQFDCEMFPKFRVIGGDIENGIVITPKKREMPEESTPDENTSSEEKDNGKH